MDGNVVIFARLVIFFESIKNGIEIVFDCAIRIVVGCIAEIVNFVGVGAIIVFGWVTCFVAFGLGRIVGFVILAEIGLDKIVVVRDCAVELVVGPIVGFVRKGFVLLVAANVDGIVVFVFATKFVLEVDSVFCRTARFIALDVNSSAFVFFCVICFVAMIVG